MDLKAIEERANKATPGPWFWEVQSLEGQPRWKTKFCGPPGLLTDESYENEGYVIDTRCDDCLGERDACTPEDADFIAHAREDIPDLLAEVKALRTENAQLKDYLLRIRNDALPVDHSMAVLMGFEAGQADLLVRVKELEAALAFYADPKHYAYSEGVGVFDWKIVVQDAGQRAREVLGLTVSDTPSDANHTAPTPSPAQE